MMLIRIPQTSIEQQISFARWIAVGFSSLQKVEKKI